MRLWRRQRDRLQQLPKTKMAERGRSALFPNIEAELLNWVTERRLQGYGVSTAEIRITALKIAKKDPKARDFKASTDWCYSFLKRHNLSIRRRTHISQKLPEDYKEKLSNFQSFVIKMRKRNRYSLSQIGNADQTPLTFDLPADTTVNPKGASTVSIKTTGNEKNRFTVMLACTADGGKLPPYVVFKRKTMPKLQFPKGIFVNVHPNGWFDDDITKDCIRKVWGRRPGADRGLLVLDAFRCHRSEAVKNILKETHQTDIAIIPGGMTSVLQPLDVSVNKPMKVALRQKWNSWMSGDQHTYTAQGRMRKPELDTICTWIKEAWEELDPQIIVRAFKKCCISNALDGSEDDILWEETPSTSTEDSDTEEDCDRNDIVYDDDSEDETPLSVLRDIYRMFGESDNEEFEGF